MASAGEEEESSTDPGLIHSCLEEQRARLESHLGLPKLMAAYRLVSEAGEEAEDEGGEVDHDTLCRLLGKENAHLIDDIIQLVVADSIF